MTDEADEVIFGSTNEGEITYTAAYMYPDTETQEPSTWVHLTGGDLDLFVVREMTPAEKRRYYLRHPWKLIRRWRQRRGARQPALQDGVQRARDGAAPVRLSGAEGLVQGPLPGAGEMRGDEHDD